MVGRKKRIRIGIYGNGWDELVERPFRGMLQAAGEDPRIVLCDSRVFALGDDFDAAHPPWTGKLDGVVMSIGLGETGTPQQVADWVSRGRVPAVSVATDFFHRRIPTVCVDPVSVAKLAAEHLIAGGCKRFMHVGFSRSMGSKRRAEAFGAELAKHGAELEEFDFSVMVEEAEANEAHFPDAEPRLTADGEALAPLLSKSPHPLGVLALGDPFARAVWRVCDEVGLDVPGQVAIVGMNDLPVAFAQRPTMTSIHYPGEEVGRRATHLLAKLIGGARRPRKPIGIRATKLIARESTVGRPDTDDTLAQALEMIRRQACSGLRPRDLPEVFLVSRRWLEMEFQKHLGRTPLQEINRVRLASARKLLKSTELPIAQIAAMTGFSAPPGLTNFFQKHTSLSPTEYRHWVAANGEE